MADNSKSVELSKIDTRRSDKAIRQLSAESKKLLDASRLQLIESSNIVDMCADMLETVHGSRYAALTKKKVEINL